MDLSDYKVGDLFHDRTQREKKKKLFEITEIKASGFIACDVTHHNFENVQIHFYSSVSIAYMEEHGKFEWLVKGGDDVPQTLPADDADDGFVIFDQPRAYDARI